MLANRSASAPFFGSSTGTKISLIWYSGWPASRLSASCRCRMSAEVIRDRSPSCSRSTPVQDSCTRIWSISVVRATPSFASRSRRALDGMLLRFSMSEMASAIRDTGTLMWRCWISCMRRRSSISCRVICGRSRFSTSGFSARPVDRVNRCSRSSTSRRVTIWPFTTATISSCDGPALPEAALPAGAPVPVAVSSAVSAAWWWRWRDCPDAAPGQAAPARSRTASIRAVVRTAGAGGREAGKGRCGLMGGSWVVGTAQPFTGKVPMVLKVMLNRTEVSPLSPLIVV